MYNYTLSKTTGLHKASPALSGDCKILVRSANTKTLNNVNYEILLSRLIETGSATSVKIIYDFSKTYAQNISDVFKLNVDGSRSDFYDVAKSYEQDYTILQESNPLSYSAQWVDNYTWGIRHFITQNYLSTYRFFAPLWLTPKSSELPKAFLVFRKKKPLNGQTTSNTIADIIKSDLVASYNIEHSNFGSLLTGLATDSQMTDAPLVIGTNVTTLIGIETATGDWQKRTVFNDNDSFIDDKPLIAENYQITKLFSDNKMICVNHMNIEFEFDIEEEDNMSIYDYFGVYVSREEEATINFTSSTDIDVVKTGDLSDSNLLGLIETFDYDVKLLKFATAEDVSGYVTDLQVNATDYDISSISGTRQIELLVRLSPAAGQSFTLIADTVQIQVWADANTTNDYLFKRTNSISETLTNLKTCLDLAIAKEDTLDFEISVSNNTIRIDSNSYVNSLDLRMITPQFVTANTFIENGGFLFSVSINRNATFVLSAELTTKANIDIVLNAEQILLIDGSNTRVLTIQGVILLDGRLYVTLSEDIMLDNDIIKKQKFVFRKKSYGRAFPAKYLPIATFDQLIEHPIEEMNTNFDTDAWYGDMAVLALNGYGTVNVPATLAEFLTYVNGLSYESIYVEEVLDDEIIEASSPFARLKEYDLTDVATLSKLTISAIKWGSVQGTNSLGQPMSGNTNISQNIDNACASHESIFNSYANLDRSWFVIGTKPRNYLLGNRYALSEYATKKLSINDFIDTDVDAYKEYLTHKMYDASNTYIEVPAYTYVRSKPSVDESYAVFMGVEYRINSAYNGYKMSVVLIHGASQNPFPELVVNTVFETVTLCITYAINDRICTNLEDLTDDEWSIERFFLYNPYPGDDNTITIVTSDLPMKLIYPLSNDVLVYNSLTFNSGIISDAGDLRFCIRFSDLPEFIDIQGYAINDDIQITSYNVDGETRTIDLIDVVEVGPDYIWFDRIVVTEDLTATVLLDTDNYNDTQIPDLFTEFDSIQTTELTYTIEFQVPANQGPTRFEPLKLVNCIPVIQAKVDTNELSLTPKKVSETYVRWIPTKNNLSYTLESLPDMWVFNLLRYPSASAPIVLEVFGPRNIEISGKVYRDACLSERITISEQIIRKIGNASTISTDDNDSQLPVHWASGETVMAKVDLQTWTSPIDVVRAYYDKNSYNILPWSLHITDFKNIVSSIVGFNELRVTRYTLLNAGSFSLDIYNEFYLSLRTSSAYIAFSDLQIHILLRSILETRDLVFDVYTLANVKLQTTIQDVDKFNNATSANPYKVSAKLNTSESGVNVVITLR